MAANGGNGSSGDPLEKIASILSGGPDEQTQQKPMLQLQQAPAQGAMAQQGPLSPEMMAWLKAFTGQMQGAQG